ncbi:hypothetical protein [Alicyclobacillus mengziensis]|uniref:Uncharacterized protein n=1 Tax=Alicyclobacillus mengziensis TaxID=2931921 RepID=A0A9X7Z7N0_9BACL|nr:hypothetical protein [Alicyclobacillus mengziensis]QSO49249.1 hypothetical protein JZ786_10190 [Alicyclobacillus mengziensis]
MAEVTLLNTSDNIKLARQVRDLNQKKDASVEVRFSVDYREIHFSGEIIYLPQEVTLLKEFTIVEGELVTLRGESCILDRNRAKTVNVHLDSELVAEINAIRDYIALNKNRAKNITSGEGTQHEILLEMLRRGIDKMKDDLGLE